MRRRWTRNSKEVKKLKKVKFAVEAIEMDETVKSKFKDARIAKIRSEPKDANIAMDAYYGSNSAKWTRVENGQDVESEGIIEPSDVVVVGTSQRERRIGITS